jgi:hypothetical protein
VGPQGSYDTHGWWAQQQEAARQEALRRAGAQDTGEAGATHPSTTPNLTMTPDDKAAADAEEQGW